MRFLIGVPALVLLVLFALSNKQPTRLFLWPTDITLDAPLSLAVLVASAVFFLAGALMTWGASLANGARARRAEEQVRQLQAQVRTLQARPLAEPQITPPVTATAAPRSIQASGSFPPARPMAALPSSRA